MAAFEKKSIARLILKVIVRILWAGLNIIIFIIAPLFIVNTLIYFDISLNILIVYGIYALGGVAVGLSIVMSIFSYGTKKRAIAALNYTVVVIFFLIMVLTHLGGDFGQILVDLEGITLLADVNLFSNLLIGTVIGYGVIYTVELIAVLKELHRRVYTILKIGSAACICFFLLTAVFFIAVMYSATQIGGNASENPEYRLNFQNIIDPFDDTVDITYNITINNGGFLPIYDVTFNLDMYVNDSTMLSAGLRIGTAEKQISVLEAGKIYFDNITIEMDAIYTPLFIISNTTFLILIYVSTNVAHFLPVAINISMYSYFTPAMLI